MILSGSNTTKHIEGRQKMAKKSHIFSGFPALTFSRGISHHQTGLGMWPIETDASFPKKIFHLRPTYAEYGANENVNLVCIIWHIAVYISKKSYMCHQFIVEILFLSKKHMKIHKINNELSFCCLSMIGFALGFLSIKSKLKLISILFLIIYWYREKL